MIKRMNDKQIKAISNLLELIDKEILLVGENSRIFRKYKNGNMKPAEYLNKYGYHRISSRINGENVFVFSHRLLFAFYHGIENLDANQTIHHIDSDKLNNKKENLIQISRIDNINESVVRLQDVRINRMLSKSTQLLKPRIYELVKNNELQREQIIKKLRISDKQFRNYETGHSFIPIDKAYILAALLNCKVDDLYTREEDS